MHDIPPIILKLVFSLMKQCLSGIFTLSNQSLTKPKLSKICGAVLFACSFVILPQWVSGAEDDFYSENDLLLFFQNPAGTIGRDKVVYYSLGSTSKVFRDAATPTSLNYGSTIPLGNIGEILTNTYGADWTLRGPKIFIGAVGQNGDTSALSTSIRDGDYARTVYITKARVNGGTLGLHNSNYPLFDPANTSVAGFIAAANRISAMTQPGLVTIEDTLLDYYNGFSNSNPATAYGAIPNGIQTAVGTPYQLGDVQNIVAALDLYRVSKSTGANATDSQIWHIANDIRPTFAESSYPGPNGARADFLGVITIDSSGIIRFIAKGSQAGNIVAPIPQITESSPAIAQKKSSKKAIKGQKKTSSKKTGANKKSKKTRK
jgi:hypothetical protein